MAAIGAGAGGATAAAEASSRHGRAAKAAAVANKKYEAKTLYIPYRFPGYYPGAPKPSDIRAKTCPLYMPVLTARVQQSDASASAAASAAITTRDVAHADEINSDILDIYSLDENGDFLHDSESTGYHVIRHAIADKKSRADKDDVNAMFEYARACFVGVRGGRLLGSTLIKPSQCPLPEDYEKLDMVKSQDNMAGKAYLEKFLSHVDKDHPYYAEAQYWLGLCYDSTLSQGNDDFYYGFDYPRANRILREAANAGYYLAHRQLFLNITRGHIFDRSKSQQALNAQHIKIAVSDLRDYFHALFNDTTLSDKKFTYMYESLSGAASNLLEDSRLKPLLDEASYRYILKVTLGPHQTYFSNLFKEMEDPLTVDFHKEEIESAIKGLCKYEDKKYISDADRFDYLIQFMEKDQGYIPLVIEHLTATDLPPELCNQHRLFLGHLNRRQSPIEAAFSAQLRQSSSYAPDSNSDVAQMSSAMGAFHQPDKLTYDEIYTAYDEARKNRDASLGKWKTLFGENLERYNRATILTNRHYSSELWRLVDNCHGSDDDTEDLIVLLMMDILAVDEEEQEA